jgi:cysteine desulfurase
MNQVYFDNAATTPLDPKVLEEMLPYLTQHFGNASSIHAFGRNTRSAIEKSRKTVAGLLNISPSEIFFTSCASEADNQAIIAGTRSLQCKHIITTKLEHHAVLHSVEYLEKRNEVSVHYLSTDHKGNININELESLLIELPNTFVTLMHANNEIGNLYDIDTIAKLCKSNNSFFHSDTVQTIGHYTHDLQSLKADFIVGSAHKFHGPKGIGFIYIKGDHKISPHIYGGSQERNMRGGTENVAGIVGLAKALELAYSNMDTHKKHISTLKSTMIEKLKASIPDVQFNGESENIDKSLYTVLSVNLPASEENDMLLMNLDINKIAASGGSACTSGATESSHVLEAIKSDPDRGTVRFSFSRNNTLEEVDYVVNILKKYYQ